MFFSLFFLLILLVLINKVSTESVNGSTHALIGNYSELNPKDCGITRLTNGFDDMCFEWHKTSLPHLVEGRNATEGEVPWIVHIVIRNASVGISQCTGSAIANQWVLTAGHCLLSTNLFDYTIHLGYLSHNSPDKVYKAKAAELHKHPNFTEIQYSSTPTIHDIALIKLEESINSLKSVDDQRVSTELKSICLPKKDIFNVEAEYALNAGWGYVNRSVLPLQMGYKLLSLNPFPMENNTFNRRYFIKANVTDNQTLNCQGDSGSPLWQFHLGRAIIIGVLSFSVRSDEVKYINVCEGFERNGAFFVRVSAYIDWIQNVTKLH